MNGVRPQDISKIDIEDNFSKFWSNMNSNLIQLLVADARTFQIPEKCSFVTSIFSLQFISPWERVNVIANIHDALIPGGALIIAEKLFPELSKLNDMLTSVYYEFKRQSFTEAEILSKERSLRSLMKLWSGGSILKTLMNVGFEDSNVQCFWRNHNFAAFIALK